MSRYGVVLILLAAVLAAIAVPLALAAQNQTEASKLMPSGVPLINVSPVIRQSGNSAISIEDARDINYSLYDSFYGGSAHVSVVTAQLYYDGRPYNHSSVPITFTSDNDSVAVLEPMDRTRPSDEHGQAKILLIANNTRGIVNITASSQISHSIVIKDTCTVWVVGWGTVSGMVTDRNQNGVPYAKMTLWVWNGTDNIGILDAPDNPQLTNDGSTAAIGTYTFSQVPSGTYNLTAEKDGHVYFAMVYMNVGTYTANVAFPDYVFPGFITSTPEPVVTAVPATPTPTEAASPSPTPSPGFESLATLLVLAAAAGICCRKRVN